MTARLPARALLAAAPVASAAPVRRGDLELARRVPLEPGAESAAFPLYRSSADR